jgi:predicted amidohydrolase YtcJ
LVKTENRDKKMHDATIVIYSDAIFTSLDDSLVSGGIAVAGARIVAVGSRETIAHYVGKNTKVYDLKNSLVVPGFGDAHSHFFLGAKFTSERFCSTLDQAHSEEECVRMMVDFAAEHPGYDRYFGHGWLPSYWDDAAFPTKRSLDKYFPDVPVYLRAVDGHSEWLNSAALKESGYTKDWKPSFGSVDTFDDGELTGLVREDGEELCRKFDTLLPEAEDKRLQKNLLKSLNAKGITTFTDMSEQKPDEIDTEFRFLKEFEENDELTVRVFLHPGTDIHAETVKNILPYIEKYNSDVLRIAGLKGFADGVTSTYTAALLDDYIDKPGCRGLLKHPEQMFYDWVREANRLGLSTRVHCIGDRAVRTLLDASEKAQEVVHDETIRNTIEHIEVIAPEDIPRFADLGVVPSMQPLHLPLDEFDKINRCGAVRSHYEWVVQSLLQSGAVLALGTDYPVADYDPLPNIYSAVTRKGTNGKQYGDYTPLQKLSLAQSLHAYTYGSAYALHMEDKIGTLEAGKYADIAVIDKDLFSLPPEAILDSNVILTVMNGNVVYDAAAGGKE